MKTEELLSKLLHNPDQVTAECPPFKIEIHEVKDLIREGKPVPSELIEDIFSLAGYNSAGNDNWIKLFD